MVGQTGSLPGFHERSSQGKLAVCPTLAPRFSLFLDVATRHEGSSKSVAQAGRGCAAPAMDELGSNATSARLRYSRRRFSLFQASKSDMLNSSENPRVGVASSAQSRPKTC